VTGRVHARARPCEQHGRSQSEQLDTWSFEQRRIRSEAICRYDEHATWARTGGHENT
jgi:hypothetical protein